MKKHGTRKRRTPPRRTRKQRKQKGGYGDQTIYFVSEESPSRPGYPIVRVLSSQGDNAGGVMGWEQYLSEATYDIEDQLIALKMNRGNKKVPKKAVVKKVVIRKPVYIPKT